MKLVFSVAGDKQIERELLRWGDRALDARPAFDAIGDLFVEETKEQFDTEGKHASGGWRPLKPATLASKRRRQMRLEILQETGALVDSLTQRGDQNMIFQAGPTFLRFGTKLPYAAFHQRGNDRLPRRRPLEFTEATRRTAVKILQRFIVEGTPA